ncbi:MAG: GNAT family N-acetyltransferase [Actinomycetes bacterium]
MDSVALPEAAGLQPLGSEVRVWELSDLAALVSLCDVGFARGLLNEDDLEMCFPTVEDPLRTVLGTADGTACVVLRGIGTQPSGRLNSAPLGRVELVVTHPSRRRRGLARSLLLAAEGWARGHGAHEMCVGGHVPLGLFSGVDLRWTAALCLAESMGYESRGLLLDYLCPTLQTGRIPCPPGVQIARVESDDAIAEAMNFAERNASEHLDSILRAARAGTAVVAIGAADRRMLGLAVHSVFRVGVIAPVVIAAEQDVRGDAPSATRDQVAVLAPLLDLIRSDMSIAGIKTAEIVYAKSFPSLVAACEARTGRVSQIYSRDLRKLREG